MSSFNFKNKNIKLLFYIYFFEYKFIWIVYGFLTINIDNY